MNNQSNQFSEKLLGQETMDSQLKMDYQTRMASMTNRKSHWLVRLIFGLLALGGIVFSISLCINLFDSYRQSEVELIVKCGIFFLLVCVLFYTFWAAAAAIGGRSLFGSAPSVVLGAVIVSGFFACLWSFLIFVLPRLMQLYSSKSGYPFESDLWIVGTVCMFLIMGFFGVLTAGVTIVLHLLCKYHGQNQRKLLEIELALADMSEKKNGSVSIS
jgi:hypothetical protein